MWEEVPYGKGYLTLIGGNRRRYNCCAKSVSLTCSQYYIIGAGIQIWMTALIHSYLSIFIKKEGYEAVNADTDSLVDILSNNIKVFVIETIPEFV